jgi:zinc D-Ala-D-Ala carboxypeptidase
MALASTALLAPHFSAAELGADLPDIPAAALSNLYVTAQWLEKVRALFGAPVIIDSGWRSWAHNTETGGSPTSDHPNGLAADFKVQGFTAYEVYQRLQAAQAAGTLPAFDQLIWYALDDHIHVGLGAQMRHEILFKTAEGSYIALIGAAVTRLRGYV